MTFEQLLSTLGVPYRQHGEHHHVSPGWLGIDCPLCSPGWGKYRLGYNLRYGYCSCWVCGKVNLTTVVSELTGKSRGEVGKLLGGLERTRVKEEFDKRGQLVLPKGIGDLKKAHKDYLKSRGFDPDEIVEKWKVQGIGVSESLSWRLFIPVHYRGEVVSWTTRSLSDKGLRYISAPAESEKIGLKKLLYGEDQARNAICIVEGPLDVWAIGPGAVSTCGLSYSSAQLLRMLRYSTRVICFDTEPAAQKRARNLMRKLQGHNGRTINVVLETGKDPASCSKKELRQLRSLIT